MTTVFMTVFVIAAVVSVIFFLTSGHCFSNDDEDGGITLLVMGLIILIIAMASFNVSTKMDNIGFPADKHLLEEGIVCETVWQQESAGKFLVFVKQSDGQKRLFLLDEEAPEPFFTYNNNLIFPFDAVKTEKPAEQTPADPSASATESQENSAASATAEQK